MIGYFPLQAFMIPDGFVCMFWSCFTHFSTLNKWKNEFKWKVP